MSVQLLIFKCTPRAHDAGGQSEEADAEEGDQRAEQLAGHLLIVSVQLLLGSVQLLILRAEQLAGHRLGVDVAVPCTLKVGTVHLRSVLLYDSNGHVRLVAPAMEPPRPS